MAPRGRRSGTSPFGITKTLKDLMWRTCGVVRSREGLEEAREQLASLEEQVDEVSVPDVPGFNPAWQESLDLRNQVVVARAVVEGALLRDETRGAHARSDFPDRRDEAWLRYLVMRRDEDGGLSVESRPVSFSHLAQDAVVSAS
jgi:succinate dehydrogenase / fumarate reductase flavoprotein subunit/fumarate reductase flavoprotein subunit